MNDVTISLPADPILIRPAAPRRPHVWRWTIAFLVSISMILGISGIAVVAQTGSTGGPTFLPATAIAYGEIRLDLPGEQRDQLAEFMSHFPGFADPATFDTKLDELLNTALSSASGGAATWTGNIEPWSDGQFALGVLTVPTTAQMSTEGETPSLVAALGVKDRTALEAQIATLLTAEPISTQLYGDTTITTRGDTSYAVTDEYLLVSPSAEDLKVSLDVLAGTLPSLAESAEFQAAMAGTPADHLAEVYLSVASFKPLLVEQLAAQDGGAMLVGLLDSLPNWVSAYAQVAGDHVTVAGSTQFPSADLVPAVRATDIAAHFPAGSLLFVEVHDVGRTIDMLLAQIKEQLAADPDTAQVVAGFEQQLGTTMDKFLDVVDDAGFGVSFDAQQLSGGIVATLSDEPLAARRIQGILGLLAIASGAADAPFSVSTEDVNGVRVTTITLQGAAAAEFATMPIEPKFSVAVTGGHLYLGLGDFAATAVAQDPQTSLATDPRYVTAITEAGTPNAGVVWLDLAAVVTLAEGMGMMANTPDYTTEIKPFADALDTFVAAATVEGDITSLKALLFVK
jgi:hypothetical protein